ncbi:hypothetical protein MKQ68_05695 [Chitinophaga horti]|uniref:Uncharacterized protein n=1 Tax=Chitinophaga horti TaxID=2920382 RepID=A0ABY6J4J1_9BACT|nr:hypothetical protein [Chitinophaga horti]UYQ94583.1 hypothetical protein MKQ68_05695 [Chitinophaga horti]
MATATSLFQFTGRLGNLVGYRVKGKLLFRTMPETVRQTAATRRAARDFGTASHAAATLRHGIAREIILHHDDTFANRLNKAMVGVVKADIQRKAGRREVTTGNLHALKGFQINQHRDIRCAHAVQRLHNGNISVTVTQPLAQFHSKTPYIQFRAIAIFPDMETGKSDVTSSEVVTLHNEQRIDAFCLTIPTANRGACIVILEAIACRSEKGKPVQMGYRKFNAFDIIEVLPPAKKEKSTPSRPAPRKQPVVTRATTRPTQHTDPG